MDKETVVILGASFGQMGLINECRNRGCYVIAVTPNGNYPGLSLVDEVIYENVTNVSSIYDKIKDRNVKAILHDQLDIAVISAAQLSSMLGIKGIPVEIAKRFTDKSLMREFAEKSGIAIPKSVVVKEKSEIGNAISSLHFPLIMKPLDSSASHGVHKVDNYEEILCHFDTTQSYSTSNKVIIEEFIEGQEFVVEAFTRGYKTYNLVIGRRSYFNIPNTFIPNMTIFKSADASDSDVEIELKRANVDLVASMELEYGMTHAEFIYNAFQNRVYLVEIAARGGGVHTSTDIVPAACGVNFTKLYVDEALNYPRDEIKLISGCAAYFCFILPEGNIVKVSGIEKLKIIPGVICSELRLTQNSKTPPIIDKYARQGPVVVKGNSEQECLAVLEKIKSTFSVTVDTLTGTKCIIWD